MSAASRTVFVLDNLPVLHRMSAVEARTRSARHPDTRRSVPACLPDGRIRFTRALSRAGALAKHRSLSECLPDGRSADHQRLGSSGARCYEGVYRRMSSMTMDEELRSEAHPEIPYRETCLRDLSDRRRYSLWRLCRRL